MQAKTVNRIRGLQISLTGNTDNYLTLLNVADAPDYDVETDLGGTNIAQAETGSHISKIRIDYTLMTPAANGVTCEVMLFKDPDQFHTTNITPANLWDSDYSSNASLTKKNTMLYRLHVTHSSAPVHRGSVFIKRKALLRNGFLRENDQIRILFSLTNNASASTLWLTGKIYTRK